MSWRPLVLVLAVALAAGCARIPTPIRTEGDLQQQCLRVGGWWRPDKLMGGYCELQAPGMI